MSEALVVIGISIALGCDAFAVGLAIGTTNPDPWKAFRIWFHFGIFQCLMTLCGWGLGSTLLKHIEAYDHWVAFGLLFVIAFRMLRESLKEEEEEAGTDRQDPTRGLSLIALCLATSMDALGVGFGMGVAGQAQVLPSVIIGIVAALMTFAGVRLGTRLSHKFGRRVETFGALILFAIAFKLLSI